VTITANLTRIKKQHTNNKGINNTSRFRFSNFEVIPFPAENSLTIREANKVIKSEIPNDNKRIPTEALFKMELMPLIN
jgi:hypothetical protein